MLFHGIGAGKRAREAQKAIEEYDRQELTNPYANLQVSTAGADLQRADIARSVSTFADNAALGGSRAVLGLLPNVLQQQIGQEQKIAADLDQQYIQNTQLAAQGAGMVQQMQEQRENADLAGLGQALQTARQERANGFNTIAQGALGVMGGAAGGLFGAGNGGKVIEPLKVKPAGLLLPRAVQPTFPTIFNPYTPKIG